MFDANIIPFCERDSSILRFWCPQGSWHQALGMSKDSRRELTETFFFLIELTALNTPTTTLILAAFLKCTEDKMNSMSLNSNPR